MIQTLSMKALAEIDNGRIREAYEQALRRAQSDCKDRPALERARKVSLTLTIVPVVGDNGELESCNVDFQIKEALPPRESRTYNMAADDAGLHFNELSRDDIRQRTIDQVPGPKKAVNSDAR